MNQIDDVIIDRELKKLYLDSNFLESFYNALDFIQEDLCALWGSEEAVNFGSYIKKLKEMPNELNEAIYDLGEKALEELKDQLSDYDKAKSDLRMYCVFAKHRDDNDVNLNERIEDSRITAQRRIKVLTRIDFAISLLLCLSVVQFLLIYDNNIFKPRKVNNRHKLYIQR